MSLDTRSPAISLIVDRSISNERSSTPELIYQLCKRLEEEELAYCHWKSNNALDRSASGDNDLDVLISRTDAQRFTEILYRLKFKQAKVPIEMQLPGVLDYYGYDEGTDKLVHVHAHYQLVLGHDRTKNFRLPIEEPFLASATQVDLFKVPAPEFEFIVFVIRMVLKYSTWDAILSRGGALPAAARLELETLQPQVNWTRIYDHLREHLPSIDAALFDACAGCLRPDCPSGTRIKVGQQLQKSLVPYARRPQTIDVCLKTLRRVLRGVRRRLPGGLPRKRLAHGGLMIALVGGDGAGKSTAVDELHRWLSREFDTVKVHLGKPAWSWTTYAVRGSLRVGSSLVGFLKKNSNHRYDTDHTAPEVAGSASLLRGVCLARDRYRAYAKAWRFAANGGFVICDRFPLPQIKLMDGPQLQRMVNSDQQNPLVKFLVRLEKEYYSRIVSADLLIVLRVDPEVAVQRKTDEDATSVRLRCREIWELDWQQTRANVIDASQPRANVLSELKSFIWSAL